MVIGSGVFIATSFPAGLFHNSSDNDKSAINAQRQEDITKKISVKQVIQPITHEIASDWTSAHHKRYMHRG